MSATSGKRLRELRDILGVDVSPGLKPYLGGARPQSDLPDSSLKTTVADMIRDELPRALAAVGIASAKQGRLDSEVARCWQVYRELVADERKGRA